MNRRQVISAVSLSALTALAGCGYRTVEHRFRLTLEMDTPDGIKSAFSIIAVEVTDTEWTPHPGSRFMKKMHGEAVFMDLGNGRNAILLLPPDNIVLGAFDLKYPEDYKKHDAWLMDVYAGKALPKGAIDLKRELIPSLVTFTDIANPASAKVIFATDYRKQCREDRKPACVPESIPIPVDEIATTFGPGYAFKRATVEIVPNDTPVTRGIDARLPQIMSKLDNLNKGSMSDSINAPFWVRAGHLTVR